MKPLGKETREAIGALVGKVKSASLEAKKGGEAYLGKFPVRSSDGRETQYATVLVVSKGRTNQTAETDLVEGKIRLFLSAFPSLADLRERMPRLLEHEASHVRDHLDSPARRFESPAFLRAGKKVREAIQKGQVALSKKRDDLSVGARSVVYARDVIDDGVVQGILHDGGVLGEEAQLAVLATALRNLPGRDVKKDYVNSSDELRAFVAEAASEIRSKIRGGVDVGEIVLASKTWKHVKPRMTEKNRDRFIREVRAIVAEEKS